MAPASVRRAVRAVLHGEGVTAAAMSVTFLNGRRMRGLNRRTFGRDCATDVIALQLAHPGMAVGDIYICPSVARRRRERGVEEREEIIRLVVHGTLHALGYEHPERGDRARSTMWQRQERYVQSLVAPRQ